MQVPAKGAESLGNELFGLCEFCVLGRWKYDVRLFIYALGKAMLNGDALLVPFNCGIATDELLAAG
jgi:hypothetical protein